MQIKRDDLSGPEIAALLEAHLADFAPHSPPESRHALDLSALRHPDIFFYSVWEAGELLGCGAFKRLDATHAELKSMRTDAQHLRRGVARALLTHLIDEARAAGFERLSLETGSAAHFDPAHRLYAAFGFETCGPFGDYVEDPYSVFMTRRL
ncbi:GNAT family N-acetyltransferase [Salinicola endophyticus]|uniref:GNAT family N-acetyltransferase n=1 Tax=Salinicola endophyticus TaxID=1949083 RepID=A0ABY8FL74_9GAMM|nr:MULTISPECIES: GNAT family N-acetyltransferase [Salinicola]WFF41381.1 GNAT family N-acetyltransferase [Salinicola endophyticus]